MRGLLPVCDYTRDDERAVAVRDPSTEVTVSTTVELA